MFQFPSFGLFSGGKPAAATAGSSAAIQIPSVLIHDIETGQGKTTRALKHLIRANHVNHGILFHELRYHNHLPHIVGSAYLLDAKVEHLNDIYDSESSILEPWKDSPGEISKHDWWTYLGDKRYQRAFVDFFEDELVQFGYDWKKLVAHYLFASERPLINSLVCGLAHPLIHIGYAYELSNPTLAIEALALTTTCQTSLHEYLDDPKYTFPAPNPTSSLIEIFTRLRSDPRAHQLLALAPEAGEENEAHRNKKEELILEYWNSWFIDQDNPKASFEASQRLAVLLLIGTPSDPEKSHGGSVKFNISHPSYDFFLVHLLTSSHAARIVIPLIPIEHHLSLLRAWFLLALRLYVSQGTPAIDEQRVPVYELPEGKNTWDWVRGWAVDPNNSKGLDAHYVKALRSMHESARTWGDEDGWFLKAAVRFAEEFSGVWDTEAGEMEE